VVLVGAIAVNFAQLGWVDMRVVPCVLGSVCAGELIRLVGIHRVTSGLWCSIRSFVSWSFLLPVPVK